MLGPCLSIPGTGAQQAVPVDSASQQAINEQLLARLRALEEEVRQLKTMLPASMPTTAPAELATAPVAAPVSAPAAGAPEAEVVNEVAPRLKLELFGDVGAQSISHDPRTFLFGSLDLFTTSRITNKITALGELLFIAQNDNNVQVEPNDKMSPRLLTAMVH